MATILIVEDDTLLSQAVATALEEGGHAPLIARNADAAFQALEAQKIDLIYLDIMLPETDGYDILKSLKADTRYQQIPVIMLSNLGQMSEIDRAMEMGAVDYITKASIDLSKLIDLTNKKLSELT